MKIYKSLTMKIIILGLQMEEKGEEKNNTLWVQKKHS